MNCKANNNCFTILAHTKLIRVRNKKRMKLLKNMLPISQKLSIKTNCVFLIEIAFFLNCLHHIKTVAYINH